MEYFFENQATPEQEKSLVTLLSANEKEVEEFLRQVGRAFSLGKQRPPFTNTFYEAMDEKYGERFGSYVRDTFQIWQGNELRVLKSSKDLKIISLI